MSDNDTLYYGSPSPVREITGPNGIIAATPFHGMAMCMGIKRAAGVRYAEITTEDNQYQVVLHDGYPSQDHIYIYRVSSEGFRPTQDPAIFSRQGSVVPLGDVEKICIWEYKHYFRRPFEKEED